MNMEKRQKSVIIKMRRMDDKKIKRIRTEIIDKREKDGRRKKKEVHKKEVRPDKLLILKAREKKSKK